MKNVIVVLLLCLCGAANAERIATPNCELYVTGEEDMRQYLVIGYLEGAWALSAEGTVMEAVLAQMLAEYKNVAAIAKEMKTQCHMSLAVEEEENVFSLLSYFVNDAVEAYIRAHAGTEEMPDQGT